jgi:hypothetical protein
VPLTDRSDDSLREAEATAERIAPGYVARVRAAAARLAVGAPRGGDLEALLADVQETASIDVDVPTLSRRTSVRGVKTGVKALTGWYLRYVGQQVTAFGNAVVSFGTAIVERTGELEAAQAASLQRLQALEARVQRLETDRPLR